MTTAFEAIRPMPAEVDRPGDPGAYRLDGRWRLAVGAGDRIPVSWDEVSGWQEVDVPGEPWMQGIRIEQEEEFLYAVRLPAFPEGGGRQVSLRFSGVYSSARVWVDGALLGGHTGGFTSWEVKLTGQASGALLVVGVTDDGDSISGASRYAMHPIGGILRSVHLIVRDRVHLRSLDVDSDVDLGSGSADMRLTLVADGLEASARVEAEVRDPDGRACGEAAALVTGSDPVRLTIPIENARLWDAEHPRLYTVDLALRSDGEVTDRLRRRVGLRRIDVDGVQLRINGKPVFLRGVNRHDMHPTLGRVGDRRLDRLDAELFKEANVNYVRTSHYPPTEEFLDAADELGLFVEEEAAVCFQNDSVSDPARLGHFVQAVSEMVARDRNHPSIVIWSAGNESSWGPNARAAVRRIHEWDHSRPVKYSWGHLVTDDDSGVDIYSQHYPRAGEDPGRRQRPAFAAGMPFLTHRPSTFPGWAHAAAEHWSGFEATRRRVAPVVNDEWVHVPCYDLPRLRRDPGAGDRWSRAITVLTDSARESPTCLGGAIWAAIDEIFHGPDGTTGYGPWGILDVWRRRKPEFEATQRAYSPLAIDLRGARARDGELLVPVVNHCDHTGLEELTFVWEHPGGRGSVPGPRVGPGGRSLLAIPAPDVTGDALTLEARDAYGRVVFRHEAPDARERSISDTGRPAAFVPDEAGFRCDLADGSGLRVAADGVLTLLAPDGARLLAGRPAAIVTGVELPELSDVEVSAVSGTGGVAIRGSQGPVDVSVTLRPHGSRSVELGFEITGFPDPVRPQDGPEEVGLRVPISDGFDRLEWQSVRDKDGTERRDTRVAVRKGEATPYRVRPAGEWGCDEIDHHLFGPADRPGRGSREFRALKTDVRWARLASERHGLELEPGDGVALRAEPVTGWVRVNDTSSLIRYTGVWEHIGGIDAASSDHLHSRSVATTATAGLELEFEGTAFRWVGARSRGGGLADVTIDDEPVAVVDARTGGVAEVDSLMLFAADGLPPGRHRVTIVARQGTGGEAGEISLDYLEFLPSEPASGLDLMILPAWNDAICRNMCETMNIEEPAIRAAGIVAGAIVMASQTEKRKDS